MAIDLNCDLGEGCPFDADLMPLITSANIACGAHAGDTQTMAQAVQAARRHGVRIGAHPGYFDRQHFGRREMELEPDQVFQICVYQIGALKGLAQAAGTEVLYVKPHGALYHQACRSRPYAEAVVAAANLFQLSVMGLPDSTLTAVAREQACPFIAEGFADRRYRPDGTLVPRTEPDAFVENAKAAAEQVQWLVRERGVESICVHGDNPRAVEFVRALRQLLVPEP